MSSEEQSAMPGKQRVIDDLAAVLGVTPDELSPETNLLDAGLDSVRIMSLVQKWRSEGHEDIDFPMLAADPVLETWLEVLS